MFDLTEQVSSMSKQLYDLQEQLRVAVRQQSEDLQENEELKYSMRKFRCNACGAVQALEDEKSGAAAAALSSAETCGTGCEGDTQEDCVDALSDLDVDSDTEEGTGTPKRLGMGGSFRLSSNARSHLRRLSIMSASEEPVPSAPHATASRSPTAAQRRRPSEPSFTFPSSRSCSDTIGANTSMCVVSDSPPSSVSSAADVLRVGSSGSTPRQPHVASPPPTAGAANMQHTRMVETVKAAPSGKQHAVSTGAGDFFTSSSGDVHSAGHAAGIAAYYAAGEAGVCGAGRRRRFLVADEDKGQCKVVGKLLSKDFENADVDVAHDVATARRLLTGGAALGSTYDVVLIAGPCISGVSICQLVQDVQAQWQGGGGGLYSGVQGSGQTAAEGGSCTQHGHVRRGAPEFVATGFVAMVKRAEEEAALWEDGRWQAVSGYRSAWRYEGGGGGGGGSCDVEAAADGVAAHGGHGRGCSVLLKPIKREALRAAVQGCMN